MCMSNVKVVSLLLIASEFLFSWYRMSLQEEMWEDWVAYEVVSSILNSSYLINTSLSGFKW